MVVSCAALAVLPSVWLLLHDHPADVGVMPYGAREFTPKPPPVSGAAGRALRTLHQAVCGGTFWLLAGSFAICGASTNGLVKTHFVPAAHDHGLPVTTAASLLAVIGVFDIAGTVGLRMVRRPPVAQAAARDLLRSARSFAHVPPHAVLGRRPSLDGPVIVFYGLDRVATVPPTIALCREHYGESSAIVFGWVLAAHQMGAALVAHLGGVARDALGSYDVAWYTSGALCAVAALMSLVVRHRPVAAPVMAVTG